MRGRYGSAVEADHEGDEVHEGELGDEGSVERRTLGGFRLGSASLAERAAAGASSRRIGRGEGRNSSILSVSGTGSMAIAVVGYGGDKYTVDAGRLKETATDWQGIEMTGDEGPLR